MLIIRRALALFLILIAPITGRAQDGTDGDGLRTKLRHKTYAAQVLQERRKLIKQLLLVVADKKADREVRVRAVTVLGDLRAVEAIPGLIANVDQIMPGAIFERTIETMYPCIPALVKIGKPGAKAALKELRKPMKNIRRRTLVAVIAGVEGRKVGRLLLEEDIRRLENDIAEIDVEALKNLRASLKPFLAMTANERDFSTEPVEKPKPKR